MIFLLLLDFFQHLSASWAIVNNEIYCDESLEKREKKRLDDDRSPREGEARSNREIFKSKQLNPSPAPKLAIATREETFDGGALFLGVLFFSNVDFRKMGKKKNNSMMTERAKKSVTQLIIILSSYVSKLSTFGAHNGPTKIRYWFPEQKKNLQSDRDSREVIIVINDDDLPCPYLAPPFVLPRHSETILIGAAVSYLFS